MERNALAVPHASSINVKFVYYVASVLPIITMAICWGFYFKNQHWNINYLPTVSLTVVDFPESRIFSVLMSIESILLFLVYFMRLFTYLLLIRENNETLNVRHKLFLLMAFFFGFSSILGLLGTACFAFYENSLIHNMATRAFYLFSGFHYLICDRKEYTFNFKNSIVSKTCTGVIIILSLGYVFMNAVKQGPSQSISSVCQSLAFILIFVKIALIAYDSPPQILHLSPNSIQSPRILH